MAGIHFDGLGVGALGRIEALPTHMRLEQSIETAAFIRSSVVGQLLLWTNCELQEFLWRMWAN
jgi:hypothetical protein